MFSTRSVSIHEKVDFFRILLIVIGLWSTWSHWSVCTAQCNGGQRTRSRECIRPTTGCGASDCEGSSSQVEGCNTQPCNNVTCTNGKIMSNCSRSCGTTCSNLQCNQQCSEPEHCTPGCICPNGTVTDNNGNCVELSACHCSYQGGILLNGQKVTIQEKCQEW